jgi:uncharacterized protein YlaI
MKGVCKLCDKEDFLKESHFIPKFVGKWIKKTSITGYMREKNELHKRAQDTAKEYWLCGDCEQLFSKWEREFANRVFYPFVDRGESVANYDNWMSKFCASLSWRTLTYIRDKNPNDEANQERRILLDSAQDHLKKYILGESNNLYQYEQHLFHVNTISSTNSNILPPSINRYFLRVIGMDIIGNSVDQYIYTKIPSFILLGVIKAKDVKLMRSSRIAISSGRLTPTEYRWPDGFSNYIFEEAEEIIKLHKIMPEKHLEKFDTYIKENPEKIIRSKQFQAFLNDYDRFGSDVFK